MGCILPTKIDRGITCSSASRDTYPDPNVSWFLRQQIQSILDPSRANRSTFHYPMFETLHNQPSPSSPSSLFIVISCLSNAIIAQTIRITDLDLSKPAFPSSHVSISKTTITQMRPQSYRTQAKAVVSFQSYLLCNRPNPLPPRAAVTDTRTQPQKRHA
ncbi:hypothetical protein AUP68_16216 [Ilyonectria robusta]